MADSRITDRYLPGWPIPESITLSDDIHSTLEGADIILFAVPTQTIREVAKSVTTRIKEPTILISGCKGLEKSTQLRPTQVLKEILGNHNRVFAIGGPGHAEEVGWGRPTTLVIAGAPEDRPEDLMNLLSHDSLRFYANHDLAGVEWAAALKNVIAIAAGMAHGMKLGDNAMAALITRGLAEMIRFGEHFHAHHATFTGLSGMGDLITTCQSKYSRNRRVGEFLSAGMTLEAAVKEVGMVSEGVWTTDVVMELANQHKIVMPISEQVYRVLSEGVHPKAAVLALMNRDQKREEVWGAAN